MAEILKIIEELNRANNQVKYRFRYCCSIRPNTCISCIERNGMVFSYPEEKHYLPPTHANCWCYISLLPDDENIQNQQTVTGLSPNHDYIDNGFHHMTDASGRVVFAWGTLKSTAGKRRAANQRYMAGFGKPGDDGGHLIAARYGGSGAIYNHVPQASNINRGAIKRVENEMAKHVQAGHQVDYKITVAYDGKSARPSWFKITYRVEDREITRGIKNDE